MIVEDHPIEQGPFSVGQPERFTGAHPQDLDNMPGVVFVQVDHLLTRRPGRDIEEWECHKRLQIKNKAPAVRSFLL